MPKSTAITGPPNIVNAATAFTMRSAPTARGFSERTGRPVRMPRAGAGYSLRAWSRFIWLPPDSRQARSTVLRNFTTLLSRPDQVVMRFLWHCRQRGHWPTS